MKCGTERPKCPIKFRVKEANYHMYRGTITVDENQLTELIEGNITYCSSIDCEIESSVFHSFIDFKRLLSCVDFKGLI